MTVRLIELKLHVVQWPLKMIKTAIDKSTVNGTACCCISLN